MSSHDCTLLALLLVERLSLTEAAAALGMPVARLRRDYEAALARVRRSIGPVMARADLARALTRPAPAWRRAS
jgi:DNA-directed RNA polymerase specialized sigma24 family protein